MNKRILGAVIARLIAAFVISIGLFPAGSSAAHDLGIAQVIIENEQDGALKFKAHLSGSTIAGPGLPAGCKGSEPVFRWPFPSLQSISMQFACDDGLLTDDASIVLPWGVKGALVVVRDGGREYSDYFELSNGAIRIPLNKIGAVSEPSKTIASRFFVLGVEHILLGIDHLLFVLMLVLLVSNGWLLIKTITAFTVAHSITLAAATLGFVSAPTAVIESLIALSIVVMAAEAIRLRQGKTGLASEYPWIVAFGFGLLHGFGFAGALSEIGVPSDQIPIALFCFNVGVEIGQIIFVGFLISIAAIVRPLLRRTGVPIAGRAGNPAVGLTSALALCVGLTATFWFVDRLSGIAT